MFSRFLLVIILFSANICFGEEFSVPVKTVVEQNVFVATENLDSQNYVRIRLESLVNSGHHNILFVETEYSPKGFLVAGKILYLSKESGVGNNLRVIFLHSDQQSYSLMEEEVLKKFEDTESLGLDIVKVNRIFRDGKTVAIEIYYCEHHNY